MVSSATHRARAEDPDQFAFTSDQVLKLSAITRRKLDYWIRTGVVRPSVAAAGRRGTVRLFSFADLIEIRTAVWLRDLISLQLIRKVVERLRKEGLRAPLATVRFGVFESRGKNNERLALEVVMQRPDGKWESTRRAGQIMLEFSIPLSQFADELKAEVLDRRRREQRIGQVERRRGTMGSVPVVAGTRVPIRAIWNLHARGQDDEEILESYPGLDIADVHAAIEAEGQRRRQPA
jgi:uncharacterized protein (DUF433 family)